jgi:DNA modification methylase
MRLIGKCLKPNKGVIEIELKTHNIDCRDGLKLLINKNIKPVLILTDPPYNIGKNYGYDYNGNKINDRKTFDEYRKWWKEILALSYESLDNIGSMCIIDIFENIRYISI